MIIEWVDDADGVCQEHRPMQCDAVTQHGRCKEKRLPWLNFFWYAKWVGGPTEQYPGVICSRHRRKSFIGSIIGKVTDDGPVKWRSE